MYRTFTVAMRAPCLQLEVRRYGRSQVSVLKVATGLDFGWSSPVRNPYTTTYHSRGCLRPLWLERRARAPACRGFSKFRSGTGGAAIDLACSEPAHVELRQMILIEAQQLRYQQRLASWERRAEGPRG